MNEFKYLLMTVQTNPLFGEGFGWVENLSIIAVMGAIIWWLNNENKKLKEDVKKIVEAHQTDLKENNKDLQSIIERYNAFANEIKDLVSPRK